MLFFLICCWLTLNNKYCGDIDEEARLDTVKQHVDYNKSYINV